VEIDQAVAPVPDLAFAAVLAAALNTPGEDRLTNQVKAALRQGLRVRRRLDVVYTTSRTSRRCMDYRCADGIDVEASVIAGPAGV
jgi:hypothetical protein